MEPAEPESEKNQQITPTAPVPDAPRLDTAASLLIYGAVSQEIVEAALRHFCTPREDEDVSAFERKDLKVVMGCAQKDAPRAKLEMYSALKRHIDGSLNRKRLAAQLFSKLGPAIDLINAALRAVLTRLNLKIPKSGQPQQGLSRDDVDAIWSDLSTKIYTLIIAEQYSSFRRGLAIWLVVDVLQLRVDEDENDDEASVDAENDENPEEDAAEYTMTYRVRRFMPFICQFLHLLAFKAVHATGTEFQSHAGKGGAARLKVTTPQNISTTDDVILYYISGAMLRMFGPCPFTKRFVAPAKDHRTIHPAECCCDECKLENEKATLHRSSVSVWDNAVFLQLEDAAKLETISVDPGGGRTLLYSKVLASQLPGCNMKYPTFGFFQFVRSYEEILRNKLCNCSTVKTFNDSFAEARLQMIAKGLPSAFDALNHSTFDGNRRHVIKCMVSYFLQTRAKELGTLRIFDLDPSMSALKALALAASDAKQKVPSVFQENKVHLKEPQRLFINNELLSSYLLMQSRGEDGVQQLFLYLKSAMNGPATVTQGSHLQLRMVYSALTGKRTPASKKVCDIITDTKDILRSRDHFAEVAFLSDIEALKTKRKNGSSSTGSSRGPTKKRKKNKE